MLDIAAPLLDIVHIDQVREAPQVALLQQHQGHRLGLGGTVEAGHPHALGPGVEFSRNFRHPASSFLLCFCVTSRRPCSLFTIGTRRPALPRPGCLEPLTQSVCITEGRSHLKVFVNLVWVKVFERQMHFFVADLGTARGERGCTVCTVEGSFQGAHSLHSGTHYRLVPRSHAQPEDVQIGIGIGICEGLES